MTCRFLVTGATGKTGAGTVRLLRERHDRRSAALAALGADVVAGDLRDLAAVTAATRGAEGVYLCYPVEPGLIEATATVAQAAADNQVATVVNMSQVSARRDAVSNAAKEHWLAERLLDRGPFRTTHLRPTFFADWMIWGWSDEGDGGVIGLPFGSGRHAPITSEDQARVIATVLDDPLPHAGRTYQLYGPRETDHTGIAAVLTRVLGRPVRYEPMDLDAYRSGLLARGLPAHIVQHFAGVEDFAVAHRDDFHGIGQFAVPNPVQEN
ncbi:NAD(P)H-binding protein [Actinoplanes sp. NPDC048988]|uniref:NAD(P)H-binding protein n=1 Tax=Actinoplanes sp. NPDC048988 TaxID=3363901 RepID=UPI00371988E8